MRVVFDKYTDDAGKLLKMMRRTVPDTGAVALEDDGFLPNTIFSLYEYFVYGVEKPRTDRFGRRVCGARMGNYVFPFSKGNRKYKTEYKFM